MRLDVFLGDTLIGFLQPDSGSGGFGFSYDRAWCTHPDSFALSPALALPRFGEAPAAYASAARFFFENLLPEGEGLEVAAATHRVARSNVLGLLRALGYDMAGAITVRSPGGDNAVREPVRRLLPRAELSERIRARPFQPFSVWDGTVRLSVAGYQDKLGILIDDGQWYLVDGGQLASTHLLKPEPSRPMLAGLTTNEFACLRLAQAVGLSAAEASLLHLPEPVLVITRFDRQLLGGKVLRETVIDGCQALGLPVQMKYERPFGSGRDVVDVRDGASNPKLFAMIRAHATTPLTAMRDLLRLVIFNVLIGNVDAHAKNLTFFVSASGLRLGPAYDLVSRFGIEAAVDSTYAFAIGDGFCSEELSPYEWALFAEDCQVPPRLLSEELAVLAGRISAAWPDIKEQVIGAGGDRRVLDRIGAGVLHECARHRMMSADIAQVPREVVMRDVR